MHAQEGEGKRNRFLKKERNRMKDREKERFAT
jgi:hypothetical protein